MEQLNSLGYGVLLIILGTAIVWFVWRSSSNRPFFSIKFRGYALGIGLIIYGMVRISQIQ